jgi:cell division protein FtsW
MSMAIEHGGNTRKRSLDPRPGATTETAKVVRTPKVGALKGPVDHALLAITILLVAFGIVMVYSASAVYAGHMHHDAQYYLVRQSLYALVGFTALTAAAKLDYRQLRKFTYPLLALTVFLLAAVLVGLGHSAGGAARWLRFGPIRVQPAEIAKVTLVLWLAHSLAKKNEKIRTFAIGFLPHLLMAGVLMMLCLRQPDMGSAVVLLLLTFILLFVAGARSGYILGALLGAMPVAWYLVMGTDYRRRRWEAFVDPWRHRHGSSYQLVESMLSFGNGGVSGVGLGDSRQKLLFLPEAHTDFISAIVGEELGFLGMCGLIAAYCFLIWRGVRIALNAADDHGTYLAFGLTSLFSLQALINLGVAMGVLPTKGLTLPFISFGGSSLVVDLAAVGILLAVSRGASTTPSSR